MKRAFDGGGATTVDSLSEIPRELRHPMGKPNPKTARSSKIDLRFSLVDDDWRFLSESSQSSDQRFKKSPVFSIELHRRATLFGDVEVDQFGMALSSVYGQRNHRALNGEACTEYFRERCTSAPDGMDDEAQETYILSKLLPIARSNGSRRVFEDSMLSKAGGIKAKSAAIQNLETQLRASRLDRMERESFYRFTKEILRPTRYSDEIKKLYQRRQEDLLGESRRAMRESVASGLKKARSVWQGWMKSISRRSGNRLEKQVLDVFSYECRAAMHRCYSALWNDLLPQLAKRYSWTDESFAFHRLWHLTPIREESDSRCLFLFHSHVFALHPGTWLFAQCPTGGALIADHLRQPDNETAYLRLLQGLAVGFSDYVGRGTEIDLRRQEARRRSSPMDVDQVDLKSDRSDRRRGRS